MDRLSGYQNVMLLAIITQMPTPEGSTVAADAGTVLQLFALLAHLVSWCLATYISTILDRMTTRQTSSRVVVALALLGTVAWIVAVLLRTYDTATFVVFVASCLVTTILLIFVLVFVTVMA